jgi:hypothetical protein
MKLSEEEICEAWRRCKFTARKKAFAYEFVGLRRNSITVKIRWDKRDWFEEMAWRYSDECI